jgi:hypothetical protein
LATWWKHDKDLDDCVVLVHATDPGHGEGFVATNRNSCQMI